MTREEPLYVPVENRSDDVLCPECNEKMMKQTYPNFPISDPPKSNDVTGITGHAYCENADCPVHKETKIVDWSYRTGEVAYQGTDIPAAEEGEPFRHPLPDKEPDGESES